MELIGSLRFIIPAFLGLLCLQHTWAQTTPDIKLLPPKGPNGEPVTVKLNLELINVGNIDVENSALDVYAWPSVTWTDSRLAWDPKFKYNATRIRLPVEELWIPDLMPYNGIEQPETISPNLVLVYSNGMAVWIPSMRMRVSCDLTEVSAKEGANCSLKIGSWTYSGEDLVLADNPTIGSSHFFSGSRYDLLDVDARRDIKKYDCCPEKYYDVKFSFTIRDKSRRDGNDDVSDDSSDQSSGLAVSGNNDNLENELEGGSEEKDLAKEIERLVRSQVRRNTKRATVLTRSKGFTKSFIWQG